MDAKSYDAIVIGGGCNGLCLAAYLQRSGMQVAIFERRHEEGGPVWTWENPASGYLGNHAQYMEFVEWMPFYHDFGLEALGARTVYPDVQAGIGFSDGRPPIVLYSVAKDKPGHLDLSRKSIAVYSKRDADTFAEFRMRAAALEPAFANWWYNPPPLPSPQNPDPMNTLALGFMDAFGLPQHYSKASARDLIDNLFETPELRTLLYKMAPEWGCPLELPCMGAMAVVSLMFLTLNSRLCIGGTHTLAHAMVMAAVREGVHVHEASEVRRILVKNGAAVGVQLADGSEVTARKLVASNADTRQTLLEMVGERHLSPLWIKRVKAFKYGPSCVVGLSHMAVHEAPEYRSARHDPNLNRAFYAVAGFDTPEEVAAQCRDAEMGVIPEIPGVMIAANSLFDPRYAPAGRHGLYIALYFPPASSLTRAEWQEVKATYNERLLQHLVRWAPNMTRANVIADRFMTPLDFQEECRLVEGDFCNGAVRPDQLGHNRPFPEAAHHRTEIGNLYLCGPGQHPMGGVSCGPGYGAFKIIAEDFGLERIWERSGRGY